MLHSILNGGDLHAPTNYLVENNTGGNIPALKVVTFTGIGTNFPSIRTVSSIVDPVRGVTMTAIANTSGSNVGYITGLGFLIDVDTHLWPVGTQLFADSSGNLTTTVNGPLVATVYQQDPVNGYLFIEDVSQAGSGGGGSGDVVGPGSATDKAIARFDGTTGRLIQDSPYSIVQDGGAVQAQAFVSNRQILHDVNVPNHYEMFGSDIELISGDIILNGDAQLILL